MSRAWRPLLAFLATAIGATLAGPAAPRETATKPAFTSLAGDFAKFYDETAQKPESERIAAFRTRFAALFPGFYEPRYGRTDAQYDSVIGKALDGFPDIRSQYARVTAEFPQVLATGVAHFRATFPDFHSDIPIYLLHSLGEMDGGTRTIRKRNVMIFGADVIARLHADDSIGPFFDHELFHIYHGRFYGDCPQIRCALWQEGLATYAASVMNGTTDPHMLMLDTPEPIVPAVDAEMRTALCVVSVRLNSTGEADYIALFLAGKRTERERFPRRFGYYVGYLVAKEAARSMPLAQLARLNQEEARPVIDKALGTLADNAGGCAVG